MNWVGGARSRVKYFHNNRVQRDYFESKRLAAKVQRLQPSRRNGSQDLYFFNTTVTGKLNPGSSSTTKHKSAPSTSSAKHDNKSSKLTKLEARGDVPSMGRLELSMSPIGQPPAPDIMDVTALSTDDHNLSFYGTEHVKEQPKVSTQKLPYLIKGDSHRALAKTVTKDDALCAPESVLPRKKLKTDLSAPPNPPSHHCQDSLQKYSIDDFLNARCFNKSLIPSHPALSTKSHNRVEKAAGTSVHHRDRRGLKRGGPDVFRGPERKKLKKHQVPYHPSNSRDAAAFDSSEDRNRSVVIYDKDAMLEFQYDEQSCDREEVEEGRMSETKYQQVPDASIKHLQCGHRVVESTAAIPSLGELSSMPVASASNAIHSAWNSTGITSNKQPHSVSSVGLSEDPFSKRHFAHKENHSDQCIREDHHNSTVFNESIFGPILEKKRQQDETELEEEAMPSQASHRQVQATTKRATRPSMFERMMQSFESKGETAIKKDEKRVGQRKGEVSEKPMLRNLEWRNFITDTAKLDDKRQLQEKSKASSGVRKSYGDKHIDVCEHALPTDTEREDKPTASTFRNISVLEELICLEEENAADMISQDCPLTPADWTEDPIFTRVQDRERKVHKKACEFDSSQESVEAICGSSPNNSYNSVSVSGCTSGLNHSFLNNTTCQLSAVVDQQEHCLDERSVASHKATKDEHLSPSFPESSQVSGSTCTSVASLDNDSQKSEKIKNVESYTTAGCDSESLVSKKECAVQTTKTSTRDSSAQWSPVASVRDIGTSTEVPPTVLCCTNQLLSEVATQTDAPTESTLGAPSSSCGRETQHVVDTGVKDTTSAATVDKLRQEIATLERELSVAQSTLVWQSLMIRLHQL